MKDKFLIMEKEDLETLLKEILPDVPESESKPWLLESEAMEILGIRSKSQMWKIRTTNPEIQVSQPSRKIILINRQSLMDWLEKNSIK